MFEAFEAFVMLSSCKNVKANDIEPEQRSCRLEKHSGEIPPRGAADSGAKSRYLSSHSALKTQLTSPRCFHTKIIHVHV